jgi:NAD(P)-dependent dehydrogenase (short-subunit alcohol dehydrogenase family)
MFVRMGRLNDRAIIVTGAAQGIGATYALGLAAEGAMVTICDLTEPTATAAAITAAGGNVLSMICDVTKPAAVAAMVHKTVETFGGVHGLVNNAAMFGSLKQQHFTEIASDEWDMVMAVNTRGPFECVKACVPQMRKQRYGKIVNIASGTLFKGTPNLLHYVASKGAVVAMTRVMARELGMDNIMVNCIAPGLTVSDAVIETYSKAEIEMNKATRALKRQEQPEDLIGALVFFCSGESDFVTGQTLLVDGGSVMH